MSQENLKTTIMQNFWGVKEVYYGIVQVVKFTGLRQRLPRNQFLLYCIARGMAGKNAHPENKGNLQYKRNWLHGSL